MFDRIAPHVSLFLGDFYEGQHIEQCPLPCNLMELTFGYPMIYDATDTPMVAFYFYTWVSVQENRLVFPTSSLFAEIGGYMGLLLGLSVLDIAKFFVVISEKTQFFQEILRGTRH